MTKNLRKVTTWLLGALACIAMLLGIVVSNSQVKMASAADTAVSFSAAYVEGHDNEKDGYLQLRMDTNGQTWTKAQNNKTLSELPSTITDYTTINGRTLTELQNACTSELPVIVTLQPAGSFSFIRVWIPSEFMQKSDVRSMGFWTVGRSTTAMRIIPALKPPSLTTVRWCWKALTRPLLSLPQAT